MSNIQPYIILNGTDSRSISGLLISSLPPISKPQVRTQIETVDGRDGDIVTPLGFSAYDKVINIGLTYNYDVDEIIEFFNSEGIVTFSNEPDKYYRYAIYEQIDFEKLIKFKTAEVTLHVQPFKFSTTEEPELFDVVSGQAIAVTNEGNTDSRPNLTIIGSGDIDVSLNGSQILSLALEESQAVIIDTEDMNAYAAQSAIREVVADIQAKQAGDGDPSPSNIREISGYTSANVVKVGVNIVDFLSHLRSVAQGFTISATQDGAIHYEGTATSAYCQLSFAYNLYLPSGTTITFSRDKAVNYQHYLSLTYSDNTVDYLRIMANEKSSTFTLAKDLKTIDIVCLSLTVGASYNETIKFQVELGSQATEFETYSGETYNLPFEQTVYGGSLNVTTGELTVTYQSIKIKDMNWTASGDFFYSSLPLKKYGNTTFLCECLRVVDVAGVAQMVNGDIKGHNSNTNMYIKNTAWSTVSDLVAAIGDYLIVYELREPISVQLTPTQINNLLGLNNLYSDTGDITVKHKANGVIVTDTGDIVSFYTGLDDIEKGVLLNRAITGDYDKIRLRKGVNTFVLTGNAQQFAIDKYSRWI